MELHTRKRLANDFDYFTRLHQCILTKISKELKKTDLLDLFEITEVDLSDEKLDDFGDEDYILYRIEKELGLQYNTRKQLLLMTLYSYIDKKGSLDDIDCLTLFGTNNFNLVWEKICSHIMNNQLENSLGALNLPVLLKDGYDKKKKLIDLIEKPLWTITGKEAKNTLIPDLVSIFQNDGNYEFIIFDAKYYNAHLEYGITPSRQPGIESITKQYLYQLAYQKFIPEFPSFKAKIRFLVNLNMKKHR
ncbi:LlaJI family restriction endonuclease [Mesomycoplasma ovipneumoniae]|uniref:LlaJI family restriction endonuclease n=1 Tax=Mesomycoplasma ovipneumoniae TaxID=29562 RepID=UPI00207A4BF1|nr:LlaJI family restriction endonuclease [Mesomycoplasma ovipneumoniae]MCN0158285.1 LlaJI family restriction endonuclease [Mesomycoplasma ovipneumoniae]